MAIFDRCGCGQDYLTLPLDHECEQPLPATKRAPVRTRVVRPDFPELEARLVEGLQIDSKGMDLGLSAADLHQWACMAGPPYACYAQVRKALFRMEEDGRAARRTDGRWTAGTVPSAI